MLSLSHDSLTAAYLLMEDGVLLNAYQMQQLQMFCPHSLTPPAIVKAPPNNASFWTRKQLFSMLLPCDFDYSFPSNGVFVSDGELISSTKAPNWFRDLDSNVVHSLVQQFQGKSLDFFNVMREVLCEWLSMTGFSVSLLDLSLSSDSHVPKNLMEEISFALEYTEDVCNYKQLSTGYYKDFLAGNCVD